MANSKKNKKRRPQRTKKVGGVKPVDGRECIERLKTTEIDEVKKRKLCNAIIGIEDETKEEEVVQSWQEFTHIIFNNSSILEEIFKKTSSTEVCFLHNIALNVDNEFDPSIIDDEVLKTLTFVYSHYGKINKSINVFDPTIYYDTNVAKCVSKYMAISISLQLKDDGHANMLIIHMEENESGLKIIKVEHFEPHGNIFGYDLVENTRINKFIDRLVYLLFIGRGGINSKDQIEIVHPEQLCKLKQTTNNQLQQLLVGTEFDGTCTIFSLWYSFYRLLYPSLTSEEVYEQMNDRLLKSTNRTETIKMIIQTFLSLVKIDIDNALVSENREIYLRDMNDIKFKRGKLKPDSQELVEEFVHSDIATMHKMVEDGKITNLDVLRFDFTPLMIKIYNGTIVEMKWLLRRGANVNAQASNGNTALHEAVKTGLVDKIRILLDYGANVNAENSYGYTALQHAVFNNLLDILRILLDYGANVNAVNSYGYTALQHAASNNLLDIVRILLDYGADENLVTIDRTSPWKSAENEEIKRLLIERADWTTKFHESDIAGMQKMMEEGKIKNVDVTRHRTRWTPLMTKADKGTIEEMKWLLDHGANVNIRQNIIGYTALFFAAIPSQSAKEKVRLLLDYGADRSIPDDEGITLVENLNNIDTEESREIIEILQTYFPEKKGGKKLNRRTRRRTVRKR